MLDDKEIFDKLKSMNIWKVLIVVAVVLVVISITVNGMRQFETDDQGTPKINISNELMEDLEKEASIYEYVEDIINSKDGAKRSVEIIEHTSDCNTLMHLFEQNTGWTARPLLATKILTTCI